MGIQTLFLPIIVAKHPQFVVSTHPLNNSQKNLRNHSVTLRFVTEELHNKFPKMRRDVFQAIADPTRREILNLLAYRSLNVNAVSDHFRISRPAISKHMKILNECGLVVLRQEGRERYCDAQLHKLKEVVNWAETYRAFWSKKLEDLGDFLEKEKRQRKKTHFKRKQ